MADLDVVAEVPFQPAYATVPRARRRMGAPQPWPAISVPVCSPPGAIDRVVPVAEAAGDVAGRRARPAVPLAPARRPAAAARPRCFSAALRAGFPWRDASPVVRLRHLALLDEYGELRLELGLVVLLFGDGPRSRPDRRLRAASRASSASGAQLVALLLGDIAWSPSASALFCSCSGLGVDRLDWSVRRSIASRRYRRASAPWRVAEQLGDEVAVTWLGASIESMRVARCLAVSASARRASAWASEFVGRR